MRKKVLVLALCITVTFSAFAQASAESSGGNMTFEKSETSKISYSGVALEYVMPNYQAAVNKNAFTSKGIAVNYEIYSPLSAKTAVSANLSAVFLNEVNNFEFNVGLYYLLVKGFYVKPQVGFGQYTFNDPYLSDYLKTWNFTYRGQVGYLFQLPHAEGKRDKFLDLGLAYHNIGNSDLKIKYWGLCAKLLWGPKPSAN
jgi:hypothetical protein